MDYKELVVRLNANAENGISSYCIACRQAANAINALIEDNVQLRSKLDPYLKIDLSPSELDEHAYKLQTYAQILDELHSYKKYGFEPCDYANMRAVVDREKQCQSDLSALMDRTSQVCAELKQAKEKNAGLALALLFGVAPNKDCLGDDEWSAVKAELERVKRELRDAKNTLDELYGTSGRYCDEQISAFWDRWRGPQKEDQSALGNY